MSARFRRSCRFGVAGAVAALLCGVTPALSQPADARSVTAAPAGPAAASPPRPPKVIGAENGLPRGTDRAQSPRPWSIEDALPGKPREQSAVAPRPPELGRVPLQNGHGSFGFETETKVKSTEFPDGRRTPGVDTTTHKPPSYLGLSISVPTDGRAWLPPLGGKTD